MLVTIAVVAKRTEVALVFEWLPSFVPCGSYSGHGCALNVYLVLVCAAIITPLAPSGSVRYSHVARYNHAVFLSQSVLVF